MSNEQWSEWIEWSGMNLCPVNPGTEIEYDMRLHGVGKSSFPERLFWAHSNMPSDIVAYRYKIEEPGINEMTEEEEEMPAEERDNVNHPPHYQLRPGYEVYDLRQDLARKAEAVSVPLDEYSDWDRALEYLLRMWDKNMLEDAKKARWYLDKLIQKLERQ